MFYDKIASLVDTNFSDWLLKEMNKRGWSQADLARASGLNRQSVSDYVNLRRTNPEPEALVSLANAFKLPPETVFRAAGLLPQQTEETEIIQQISHLTKELPKHEQQYDKLLPLVADAVIQAIQTYKNDPAAIDSTEHITDKIHAQQTLRQRVQEGYEVGLYNQLEAQKKIVAAENEIERLTRARDRAAHQHRQKQAMLQFAEQDLNRMRAWIIEDDPATVNVFLTSLCENMIITPDNHITVNFRT